MRKSTFWVAWLAGNLMWLFGAPVLLAVWVSAQEAASGVTTSGQRDSPQILMAGFIIFNVAAVILVNAIWGIVAMMKRRRRKVAAPP
jgi:hypothetical protein